MSILLVVAGRSDIMSRHYAASCLSGDDVGALVEDPASVLLDEGVKFDTVNGLVLEELVDNSVKEAAVVGHGFLTYAVSVGH